MNWKRTCESSETAGRDNCGHHPGPANVDPGGAAAASLRSGRQRCVFANITKESEVRGAVASCRALRSGQGRCVQPPDAENRTSGGVGGVAGEIPSPRPDQNRLRPGSDQQLRDAPPWVPGLSGRPPQQSDEGKTPSSDWPAPAGFKAGNALPGRQPSTSSRCTVREK